MLADLLGFFELGRLEEEVVDLDLDLKVGVEEPEGERDVVRRADALRRCVDWSLPIVSFYAPDYVCYMRNVSMQW